MAKQLYANNATGYLNSTINNTQTSIVLESGNGSLFPAPTSGDYFYATIYDGISTIEIVKVTARTADTFTVVRGQDDTVAASFPTGSVFELRAVKANYNNLLQKTGDTATDATINTLASTTATITTATITNMSSGNVNVTGGSVSGITDLAIADGGTGASDAATARTNLGLGTIATQNANSVSITGGAISGITDLAIADGGTGASTASGARTNLGLGSIATQDASNVNITGGAISGITDLAIADGGTGASDASTARTNLGLGTVATLNVGTSANNVVQLDSSAKLPAVDGSQLINLPSTASAYVGGRGQVFTASGTFTVPDGVTAVKVTVIGGGGGGGGTDALNSKFGSGGGGGGTAIKYITGLAPGGTVAVTVGAAGSAGTYNGASGGSGGTSSFGAYCSATGGGGGANGPSSALASGGSGSSGDVNTAGGYGFLMMSSSTPMYSKSGGTTLAQGVDAVIQSNSNGVAGKFPGGGGGGGLALSSSYSGGAGAAGIVIVEW